MEIRVTHEIDFTLRDEADPFLLLLTPHIRRRNTLVVSLSGASTVMVS